MQLGSRTTGGLVSIRVTAGGSGYTAPPTVSVTGGSGSGVSAYCQMNGSAVDSVIISNAGSGFSSNPTVAFTGGGGTGAQAVAIACTTSRPISFFKGRYSTVYGVDGMGRGIRWDGSATTISPIGLMPPAFGPGLTCSTTGGKGIQSVQLTYGGAAYHSPPAVTISGGTPSRQAKAIAAVQNGQVIGIRVTDPGAGYQSVPSIAISGGRGDGCSLSVGVVGCVNEVYITSAGTGYSVTSPPTVTFSSTNGLTGAVIALDVDDLGQVAGAVLLSSGTGATAPGATAVVTGGGGTGASLQLDMRYRVDSVTAASSGTGYYSLPLVIFKPNPADYYGQGAAATATANTAGNVTAVTVASGGSYILPPTAALQDGNATATVNMGSAFAGEYQCCIRYLDNTSSEQGGPLASSISELISIDAGSGAGGLTWGFTHGALDDRVSAMELWRTTTGQSVILFRVATIQRSAAAFTGTYSDTLSDEELRNPGRDGYALMPVTLPSGQINARRFGIPPGEFAVACMFQDRAWYAVDTTGKRPNSLMYSEVDEPESVPSANELVVQENTGEPDAVVALVPLGATLLIVQSAHIYKLTYVAQPVIDASIMLAATRGVLHNRCWATMNGVVFLVDSQGMYAFDGQQEQALSIAIDNCWRDGTIDFSKSHKFHVSADAQTKTVRFFYCTSSDTEPTRALVYCVATQAWWEERHAGAVTATTRASLGGRLQPLHATGNGFKKSAGTNDDGTAVAYDFRTGPMKLVDENGNRSIDLLFTPTATDCTLSLALHYNNSSTARANAVASDRGGAFVTTTGGTAATLNLSKARSALGEARGQAKAYYAGRPDDRSVGSDKHIAIAVSGTQSADPVVIHGIAVSGAG